MKRNGLAICLCSLFSTLSLASTSVPEPTPVVNATSSYELPKAPSQKDFDAFLSEIETTLATMEKAGANQTLYTRQILTEAERRYFADDIKDSWLGYLYAATHLKKPFTTTLAIRFAKASRAISPLAMELTAYVLASNPPLVKDPYSSQGIRAEALPFALLFDATQKYAQNDATYKRDRDAFNRLLDIYGIRQGKPYPGIASFVKQFDHNAFKTDMSGVELTKSLLDFYPELNMKQDPKDVKTEARVFMSDVQIDIARQLPRRRACAKAEYALKTPKVTENDVQTYMSLCFTTNPEQALNHVKTYLETHPDAKTVPINYVKGLALWDPERATETIVETIRHKKLGELHFETLGDEALRADNPAVALEAYERCRDDCVDPDLNRLTKKEIKAYQAAGMTDEAVNLTKTLPIDLLNSLHIMQLYFDKERYDEALAYADLVMPELPFDKADLLKAKGQIYLKQKNYAKAQEAFSEALKTDKNVKLMTISFTALAKLKDKPAGLALLKEATATEKYWEDPFLMTAIARWAVAVGDTKLAKEYLDRAITLAPLSADTNLAWAEYAYSQHKTVAAVRFARQALAFDEDNADALLLLDAIYSENPELLRSWDAAKREHEKLKEAIKANETAREKAIQNNIHKYVDPLIAKTQALKNQTKEDKRRLLETKKATTTKTTPSLRVTITPINDGKSLSDKAKTDTTTQPKKD